MDEESKLNILKKDLQMITSSNDEYLQTLLRQAEKLIEKEGIEMTGELECDMAQIQYAAYLFRKRAAPDTTMPRFLRYELNNILFSQKGR